MSFGDDAVGNGLINIGFSVVAGAVFASVAYVVNITFMKGYRKDLARNELIEHVNKIKTSHNRIVDTEEITHFIREKSEVIPFDTRLTFRYDLELIRDAQTQLEVENAVDNMIDGSINPLL